MKLTFSLGLILMALWLLLSGHFTGLLISLGVLSVLFTLFVSNRMDAIDRQSHPIHLSSQLGKFWLVLAAKIFIANIDVALRILGFRPIQPQLIRLKLNQSSDLTKVLYANAITLTPGSASLHIKDGYLYVHTLSKQCAEELLRGDMAKLIPLDEDMQAEGKR